MDQNCDDILKIIVRNREYNVSKKFICSIVPYFDKVFSCDLFEPKSNKVELDFDEHVFDSILNWIHTGLFIIQMEKVISFYEASAYLMINDRLFEPCFNYFHFNFNIKHIPVVLQQVTKVSKLIDSGSIENFICRHFLKITHTDIFLNYPVEAVEAILKLDLMIHSEYQIFESIMKWAEEDDSREKWIPQLLNCVRWSFMDPRDMPKAMNDEYIKTFTNLDSIICSNVKSYSDRTKQSFFISVHRMDNSNLKVNVLDKDLFCLPIGDFTQDDSMAPEFVPGEHISDILFDSGREGIRIDWSKKTFRWLNFKVAGKTYYSQLIEVFVNFSDDFRAFSYYLEDKDAKLPDMISCDEFVFLESNGKYILIGKTKDEKKWFGSFYGFHRNWFKVYKDHERSFHATVLDNVVYILTEDLEFIQFNYETQCFNKSKPFEDKKLDFDDLIFISRQTGDDKVILVNKSSGEIHVFYINEEEWIEKYRIMNVNVGFEGASVYADGLIAFTSTFLSMKNINPLFTQNISFN
ncbi:uncharacterized protein LOC112538717 [Tetranychus urticae]|uniref:uncharacterized protein LOC112538717 n=1 Tax=Tetranychus urticae TaxID=32264 RepID=UPI000D646C58|nr:uncharacterized protein LOC112538717 [Tetranychus urticae]